MDKELNQKQVQQKEYDGLNKDHFNTDWSNIPSIRDLNGDFMLARDSHASMVSKIDSWLDNLHIQNGAKPKTPKGKSQVQPKLIRKQAEWRYPNLTEPFLSSDRLFKAHPMTKEDRTAARNNEVVLMYQFNNKVNKTHLIDTMARNLVNEGTCIAKVGWHRETRLVEKVDPIYDFLPVADEDLENFKEEVERALYLRENSPSDWLEDVNEELKRSIEFMETEGEEGVLYRATIVGFSEPYEEEEVVENHPIVDICDYRDVIFDPACKGKLENARFVIHRYETTLSNLRASGIYSNLDDIFDKDGNTISPDSSDEAFITAMDSVNKGVLDVQDNPRKKITLYEYWGYWDYDDSGIAKPVLISWVNNTIVRMEDNPYPDGKFPFVVIPYLPIKDSLYGEPDGALIEDNQMIIGAISRGMIDTIANTASGQKVFRKGSIDATNRMRMARGESFEVNDNTDVRNAVHTMVFPEIPRSSEYMLDWQTREAESLTGITSYNKGIGSASIGDVASLGRRALDAASKRELTILRRMVDGVINIGKKIIAMNSEFLEENEIIRITNEKFIEINRDSLYGDFDITLTISTFEEDAVKAQELAFMLQTMGNTLPFEMTQIVLSEIAQLRKMPDVADMIRNYAPEPDEYTLQMQQLDLLEKQRKIQAEEARTQYYMAQAQAAMANSEHSLSKARQAQSMANRDDLDFIEQESGVKHARELDLRAEQARSQEHLARVQHELKSETLRNEAQADFQKWREENQI